MKHLTITVTLRKKTTGYKIACFQTDDLNHAHSMATVLIRSPEYARCYAVATDWQGEELFTLHNEQREPAPIPMPQYVQQPALPAYRAPQQQPYIRAVPVQPTYDAYAPGSAPPLLGRGGR